MRQAPTSKSQKRDTELTLEDVAAKLDVLTEAQQRTLAGMRVLTETVQQSLALQPKRTWLTVNEAAAILKLTPQCIRGWCRSNPCISKWEHNEHRINPRQLRAHYVARFGLGRLPPELSDD